MAPPAADFLTVGFSCKCFSSLNQNKDEFSTAILDKRGTSGETADFALAYIKKHKPRILLLENVPGLATGFHLRVKGGELLENPDSNLAVLLSNLHQLGYFYDNKCDCFHKVGSVCPRIACFIV